MENEDGESIPEGESKYNYNTLVTLRIIYIVAIILWIVFIFKLKLYETDHFGKFICILPIIIWIITFYFLDQITVESEGLFFGNTYISVAMMVIIAILTWTHDSVRDSEKIVNVMILAIVLAIFSLFDVFVPKKYFSLLKHVRSIFQIASLSLIAYAIYNLYIVYPHKKVLRH